MNTDIKHRLKRTFFIVLVGVAIGAAWGLMEAQNQPAMVVQKQVTYVEPMAGVVVGGDFTLLDENGEIVTHNDFAKNYKLIFFGFTFCPAICPGELQKMSAILEALGADAQKIKPIFVSVDPERDSPEVIKDYMTLYDSRITGLTGTPDQIESIKANYRVYATKIENDMMSDYMIDHSAFMYFMSPDDKLITLYPLQDDAENIAADIRKRLASS